MYYDDHNPPHVHVVYGSHKVVIEVDRLPLLAGDLPPRALGMVSEWAQLHKSELLANWDRAQKRQPLETIEPLA